MKPRVLGIVVALIALVLDQANKAWLIHIYGIAQHQPVHLAPFFDVIFAKNPGISYSLLSAKSAAGRFALTAAAIVVILFLISWLWRSRSTLVAVGLGLIIGGAIGNNACDRLMYGYVVDFYHFYVGNFSWYVFNLADVAITFGVICLLWDMLKGESAPQTPSAGIARDGT
jgi:signal peptidase II